MEIIQKLIETEQEYEVAIERIDEIFHAPLGSPESGELKLLVSLVQKYEEERYPLERIALSSKNNKTHGKRKTSSEEHQKEV